VGVVGWRRRLRGLRFDETTVFCIQREAFKHIYSRTFRLREHSYTTRNRHAKNNVLIFVLCFMSCLNW
jgi:hypothetical protein